MAPKLSREYQWTTPATDSPLGKPVFVVVEVWDTEWDRDIDVAVFAPTLGMDDITDTMPQGFLDWLMEMGLMMDASREA